MIDLVDVVEVCALDEHRLWVKFSDGSEGEHDFTATLAQDGPMVQPLKDPAMFKRVFVSLGVPTWPNGFDVDAIQLHREMSEQGRLRRSAA